MTALQSALAGTLLMATACVHGVRVGISGYIPGGTDGEPWPQAKEISERRARESEGVAVVETAGSVLLLRHPVKDAQASARIRTESPGEAAVYFPGARTSLVTTYGSGRVAMSAEAVVTIGRRHRTQWAWVAAGLDSSGRIRGGWIRVTARKDKQSQEGAAYLTWKQILENTQVTWKGEPGETYPRRKREKGEPGTAGQAMSVLRLENDWALVRIRDGQGEIRRWIQWRDHRGIRVQATAMTPESGI